MNIGSAIYIDTDVNDYDHYSTTTGGQACINPIFAIPATTSINNTNINADIGGTTNNGINTPVSSTVTETKSLSSSRNISNDMVGMVGTNTVQRRVHRKRNIRATPSLLSSASPTSASTTTTTTAATTLDINDNATNTTTASTANQKMNTATAISSTTTTNHNTNATTTTTTATIVDCLACSGCITTTETILLQEQYNIQKLQKDLLLGSFDTSSSSSSSSSFSSDTVKEKRRPLIVVSISPASMADFCRYILSDNNNISNTDTNNDNHYPEYQNDYYTILQQLTICLYQYCHVSIVLDATIATHLTKQLALHEFVMQYNNNNNNNHTKNQNSNDTENKTNSLHQHEHLQGDNEKYTLHHLDPNLTKHNYIDDKIGKEDQMAVHRHKEAVYEQRLLPSIALSAHETQYWIPPPTSNVHGINTHPKPTITRTEIVNRSTCTIRHHRPDYSQKLPLLSSSCPAIICLIEKSFPQFVPHLSTITSPMITISNLFIPHLSLSLLTNRALRDTYTSQEPLDSNVTAQYDVHKFRENNDTGNHINKEKEERKSDVEFYYHLSVMPCHDKKLEASRNDFKYPLSNSCKDNDTINSQTSSNNVRSAVDMVITTMELVQLLRDAIIDHKKIQAKCSNDKIHQYPTIDDDDVVRKTILSTPVYQTATTIETSMIHQSPNINVIDCASLSTNTDGTYIYNSQFSTEHHLNNSLRIDSWIKENVHPIQQLNNACGTINTNFSRNTCIDGPLLFTFVPTQSDRSIKTLIPRSPTSPSYFIAGSGGYADFLFRSMACHFFHVSYCPVDIWSPIVAMNGDNDKSNDRPAPSVRRMSARTALYRKQREYYEAIIYQNQTTREYLIATTTTKGEVYSAMKEKMSQHEVVLRFVIVYGMSNVQNVLAKLSTNSSSNECRKINDRHRIDYIECMACTHSCLNGNGQIHTTGTATNANNSNKNPVQLREAPSDIRSRTQQTQKYYPVQLQDNFMSVNATGREKLVNNSTTTVDTLTESSPFKLEADSKCVDCQMPQQRQQLSIPSPLLYNEPKFFTRYHIVPPMQHTMGVSAGVAVQDTTW